MLAALYEREELTLQRGKVGRTALVEKLGVSRNSFRYAVSQRSSRAPGRCIVRFNRLLKEQGRGRVWTERLPAIRAYLERCKESGTLPVSTRGRLNRQAVLREFAPDHKSFTFA